MIKILTVLSIAALSATPLLASKPSAVLMKVQIAVPNPGWSIEIQSLHTKNDKLLIVCEAIRKDGIFASMMSNASDSVTLSKNLASLPREIYITDTKWNYSKGYTPATKEQLKKVLQGAVSMQLNKQKTSEADFIGLTLDEVKALAKQHDLKYRVVEVDGVGRAVTRDYRPERFNLAIKEGKVIRVTKG